MSETNLNNKEKVLSVKDLVVSFKTDRGIVHAVRGVSFDLYKGETLAIVGESGSGKSVTNKAIMGISSANAIIENGQILYEGEDLVRVSEEEFHRIRGHKIGMIFQDPLSALNPVMKIGKQITEATLINRNILKRKYEDLISKELTAFRNSEANTLYNINRLKSEINSTEVNYQKLLESKKKISSITKKIEKNKDNVKKAEDIKYLELELNNNNEIYQESVKFFDEYKVSISKANNDAINKYKERVERYNKKCEETKDDELKFNINKANLIKYKKHLEIINNPEFIKVDFETLEDFLKDRKKKINQLIKCYKFEEKISKNPLKKALNIRKKEAKLEVKVYHEELKKEHNEKIQSLENRLSDINLKIEDLRNKLSEEELNSIDEVILFNKKLKAKEIKESKKYHEINVSKSTKKNIEYKEIKNETYSNLLNEVELINSEISKEKENYINKTKITKTEAKKIALKIMKEVGIPMPERRFKQYPFEFSGGMRQRIVIAIALTANPEILICDEPTTALDVTIQAQILELINRLKKERNLSCIFITHDLGVVANMADRVAVMYAGKIVEYGLVNEIFFEPKHPYTWALLSSIPDVDSKEKLEAIPGTPPDMIYPPKGDAFALRSKYAMAIDFKYEPPYFKVSDTHYAATWLLYPGAPKVEMPKIVQTRIANALKGNQNEREGN